MNIQTDNIIEAMKIGAESGLGLAALVVVSISLVGITLFRKASDPIKMGVFLSLLIGVTTFAYASIQTLKNAESASKEQLAVAENHTLPAGEESSESTRPEQIESGSMETESGYVYLGTYSNGSWEDARFNKPGGELSVGDTIELAVDRKMFECAPYRKNLFSLKYTFCNDVIGTADKGQKVKVVKPPELVGLNRAWVYVEEISGDAGKEAK